MHRIAVISPDLHLRRTLRDHLCDGGFDVRLLTDVDEAMRQLARAPAALAIIHLAGAGALAVARLRLEFDLPLIAMGAPNDEVTCVVALEAGADDFIAAPPRPRELLARVQALLRRCGRRAQAATRYRFAGCAFDIAERRLYGPRGESLRLTSAEATLLSAFVDAPRRVLSRGRLIDTLHTAGDAVSDRSIDMRVLRLRRRLCSLGLPAQTIATERAHGYVLRLDVERSRSRAE